MHKILLIGKNGQVGWELQRALSVLGELRALGSAECDLTQTETLRAIIRDFKPDVIVNAAAYTAVDKAESDSDAAYAINASAPQIMAEEAELIGAWLIHYSTDYVFDGTKVGHYLEDDATHPLSVYGASKLAGEQAIAQACKRYLILRTSWVFAARGSNFAKTMLRLAQERETLKVVGDQCGAPTSAELIADVSALCIQRLWAAPDAKLAGIYHLVASGETTWHAYAQYVMDYASKAGQPIKCASQNILPITTAEYPVPAKRPANSRLNTHKIQRAFAVYLPHWQYHVSRMLAEILQK
jgi:dTDP-4-dehydrorhamnose reductase